MTRAFFDPDLMPRENEDITAETLRGLAEVRAELESSIAFQVAVLRSGDRASWSEIGTALGISKQAAQQRYGR